MENAKSVQKEDVDTVSLLSKALFCIYVLATFLLIAVEEMEKKYFSFAWYNFG